MVNGTTKRISRRAGIADQVIIIDGLTRSGKSLVGPAVSSLVGVTNLKMDTRMEEMGELYALGKTTADVATAKLRLYADMLLYEDALSRNINFRLGDTSSAWKSPNWARYLKQLTVTDGDPVVMNLQKRAPSLLIMCHHQLSNLPLYSEAFEQRLRVVEIVRHPVCLIHSWLRKGYGGREGIDPRTWGTLIDVKGFDVPAEARHFATDYLDMTAKQRVAAIVFQKWSEMVEGFVGSSAAPRASVYFVPLEKFRTGPIAWMEDISRFVGAPLRRSTVRKLRALGLPRKGQEPCYRFGTTEPSSDIHSLESAHCRVDDLHRMVQSYEDIVHHGVPTERVR